MSDPNPIHLGQEDKKQCNGRVYRYTESTYIGSRDEIVNKIKFVPLKKLSCPGCRLCGGFDSAIGNEVEVGIIPYPPTLQDADIVDLVFVNDGRCFGDLYDEYHLEFTLRPKEEK